jgi:plasmid stabilization system protein ParE
MVKIVWAPRAIKDIQEIAEFISKDSLQYADEQVKLFFTEATILEKYPHIGRMVPEKDLAVNRGARHFCSLSKDFSTFFENILV